MSVLSEVGSSQSQAGVSLRLIVERVAGLNKKASGEWVGAFEVQLSPLAS